MSYLCHILFFRINPPLTPAEKTIILLCAVLLSSSQNNSDTAEETQVVPVPTNLFKSAINITTTTAKAHSPPTTVKRTGATPSPGSHTKAVLLLLLSSSASSLPTAVVPFPLFVLKEAQPEIYTKSRNFFQSQSPAPYCLPVLNNKTSSTISTALLTRTTLPQNSKYHIQQQILELLSSLSSSSSTSSESEIVVVLPRGRVQVLNIWFSWDLSQDLVSLAPVLTEKEEVHSKKRQSLFFPHIHICTHTQHSIVFFFASLLFFSAFRQNCYFFRLLSLRKYFKEITTPLRREKKEEG